MDKKKIESSAYFKQLVFKACIYHATGAPEYSAVMDELVQLCDKELEALGNKRWDEVLEALDRVDECMADSEIGTLYQKEKFFSRRENRPNRYSSVFDTDEVQNAKRTQLAAEYTAKGIKFIYEGPE